jgi:hypothetical protein
MRREDVPEWWVAEYERGEGEPREPIRWTLRMVAVRMEHFVQAEEATKDTFPPTLFNAARCGLAMIRAGDPSVLRETRRPHGLPQFLLRRSFRGTTVVGRTKKW